MMEPSNLFSDPNQDSSQGAASPLAERMRPRSLAEFVGQHDLLAPGRPLRKAIELDTLQSIILWGPPGTGKTTVARLIAVDTRAHFIAFSAVLSGIREIKTVMAQAQDARKRFGKSTIIFIDEIHRFNKAQQDAFLPRVEAGDITLVGATTENPSFEVNAALLSRSRVFVLKPLEVADLVTILTRSLDDPERGLGGRGLTAAPAALEAIARHANGDARVALNLLELAATVAQREAPESELQSDALPTTIDSALLANLLQRRALLYDKTGEEHFNLISALHKSMRNSDPDASVYWLARMLEAGEDPLYIARRLVRFASEDIGNADPRALMLAVAAREAVHFIGMPEGNTSLAQAVLYLTMAPKSNAVYTAYTRAAADAHEHIAEPVPLHLRNAPTKLMRSLNYGKNYRYAHDEPGAVATMDCLPSELQKRQYYRPTDRGYERTISERLLELKRLKTRKNRKT